MVLPSWIMSVSNAHVVYGQATNKSFYMYNKNLNYFVRFFVLSHDIMEKEINAFLQVNAPSCRSHLCIQGLNTQAACVPTI